MSRLPWVLAAAAIAAISLTGNPRAQPDRSPVKLLGQASGGLILTNTKAGRPIVSAEGMYPGDSVRGLLRIGNAGFDPARLVLVPRFRGMAGPHGGDLAKALQVKVERVRLRPAKRPTRTGRRFRRVTRTIYQGRLVKMNRQRAGRLGPFKGNRYRIKVKLPDGGTPLSPTRGDNRFQGSKAKLNLVWRAR